jgi:hypothetical protein
MLDLTSLPLAKGNGKVYRSRRRYRSSRKHFRHGQRAAVARALTGAHLHLNGMATSLKTAAFMSGSNPQYVKAAEVLLKTENLTVLDRVVRAHSAARCRQAGEAGRRSGYRLSRRVGRRPD